MTKTSGFDPWDRPTLVTRIKNSGAPKKTRYNYLGLSRQVAAEEQPDSGGVWEVSKTYNYGPDGRPLILIDTPVNSQGGASTHLYSYNAHGDTEALTSPSTGKTTSTYRYSAYGATEKIGSTGTDAATVDPYGASATTDVLNPYRFNAMRFDPTSGKYDMGFRTYDPGLNRFLTRDAYGGALSDMALGMDPWTTNRYAFAGGNPITGIELDGHRAAMAGEEVGHGGVSVVESRSSDAYCAEHDCNTSGHNPNSIFKMAGSALNVVKEEATSVASSPWHFAHGFSEYLSGAFSAPTCFSGGAQCAEAQRKTSEGLAEWGPAAGTLGTAAVPVGAGTGFLSRIAGPILERLGVRVAVGGFRNPLAIVPRGASTRGLTPSSTGGSQLGVEYKWVNKQGQTIRLRAHDADLTAPMGSNAASGPTYRIQVGGRYADAEGNLYPRGVHNPKSPNYDPAAANATHIPWPEGIPLPW